MVEKYLFACEDDIVDVASFSSESVWICCRALPASIHSCMLEELLAEYLE